MAVLSEMDSHPFFLEWFWLAYNECTFRNLELVLKLRSNMKHSVTTFITVGNFLNSKFTQKIKKILKGLVLIKI